MRKRKLLSGLMVLSMIVGLTGCGMAKDESREVREVHSTFGTHYDTATAFDSYCEPTVSPSGAIWEAYNGTIGESKYSKELCYDDGIDLGECEPIYETLPIFDTEEYNPIHENSFLNVKTSPLSTFAADVDTASYSNFRRFVNYGYDMYDIPSGSLRTEEMINYFTYNYAKPKNNEPFGVSAMVSDCPWNDEAKLLRLGITTNDMDSKDIPSSNIVFLIDISGSMTDYNKLPLIKESMGLLLESFGEDDRISIVTYAGSTEVVLNGVSGDKYTKIMRAFNKLKAEGCTNGASGIDMAYEVAEDNFIEGGVNRVIICTDGDFNVGRTSASELEDLIKEKKDTGIFLSVLGFGMGNYSDSRMETLADCGNGNYAYIDTLAEAKKVLVDEMTSTFVTVAKDVKFQVEFNPATVSEYRLVGYENRGMANEDFTDDTKDGGELGAGHQVTVLYEIKLADNESEGIDLKYQEFAITKEGKKGNEYCTLSVAYKAPDKDTSEYIEYPIGTECYTDTPDDDFVFASLVAETSLALRDSEYIKNSTSERAMSNIYKMLLHMDHLTEYQQEFVTLVGTLTPDDM